MFRLKDPQGKDVDGQQSKTEEQIHLKSLHDDIMSIVFSYLYHSRVIGNYYQPINVMCRHLPYVSKEFYRLCMIFACQSAPLQLHWRSGISTNTFSNLVYWMSRHRVKLESLAIYCNCNSLESMNHIKMILRMCDVSNLRRVHLAISTNKPSYVKHELEDEFKFATNAGIPSKIADPSYSTLWTVVKWAKNIEVLNLQIPPGLCPLLQNLSHSLIELSLTISDHKKSIIGETSQFTIGRQEERNLDDLSHAIESMGKLKRLHLKIQFPTKIKIKSNSLEYIDSYTSHKNMWISECVCPSLRKVICRYETNGVIPMIPLSQREVEQYEGRESINVGNRPFEGMVVPNLCEVFYQLSWSDLVGGGIDDFM